jgi:chromosome partitioning protein
VISVANQKGGVGKTTTSMNLAVCLSKAGRRCLLVDVDPQCNTTSGLGLAAFSGDRHPLLTQDDDWPLAGVPHAEGLRVLAGSRSMISAEHARTHGWNTPAERLRRLFSNFDYVLLDCPPSLGWPTQLALEVSTEVLIPIQCEYFAMEGLSQMVELIQQARGRGRTPAIGGIVFTMFDPALELSQEVAAEVKQYFGNEVYDAPIPRDVALAEAPGHGLSVLDYQPRSRGARAYVELCWEVMDRE